MYFVSVSHPRVDTSDKRVYASVCTCVCVRVCVCLCMCVSTSCTAVESEGDQTVSQLP